MPFKKGLNKHLTNTAYKHSLANKPIKNSRHIPYSSILAPIRQDNSIKIITTLRTFKDTLY
jgi:hypothetical protein